MRSLTAYLERIPWFRDFVLPLVASPVRRRLAGGAFWSGLGGAASRIALLGSSFFLARVLGPEKFGEYGMVNATMGMLGALGGFGVGTTVTRYVALLRNTDMERAGRILGLSSVITCISGGVLGVCFVLLAPFLAQATLAAPHLTSALRIAAISMALGVMNNTQQAALAGFEAFKTSAWLGAVCGVFQALAVCLGAYCSGVNGAIAGVTIAMMISVVLTRFAIKRQMRIAALTFRLREIWSEWRVLVGFSLPAFLTMLVGWLIDWGCNVVLVNQPGGYGELGMLNAANHWRAVVAFLPGLLCAAAMPVMSERYGKTGKAERLQVMTNLMWVVSAVVVPVALGICLAGPFILRGYGMASESGIWVLVLTVSAAVIQSIVVPCWFYFFAEDRAWICFSMNGGLGVLTIGLAWLMIQHGALGLAAARCLAMAVHAGWIFVYAFHVMQFGSAPRKV